VRGRYDEAVHILGESLELLTERPTAYLGRDQIEFELAADEALGGNRQALSRLRSVEGRLQSTGSSPSEQVRAELLTGVVEARCGLPVSAEGHFRSALAISQKDLSRQPDNQVEIFVRLAEILASSGRKREAAEVANRGLRTAGTAYGAFFREHPFVTELQRLEQ
jgi:tetratricopeptide (TPR) repeat protein